MEETLTTHTKARLRKLRTGKHRALGAKKFLNPARVAYPRVLSGAILAGAISPRFQAMADRLQLPHSKRPVGSF